MNRPLRVLLWYPTIAYFPSLLRISLALKEAGAEPIIHAPVFFPGGKELQERAETAGVPYLCFMKSDLSAYFEKEPHLRSFRLWATDAIRAVPTRQFLDGNRPKLPEIRIRQIVKRTDPQTWQKEHEERYQQWKRLNQSLLDEADFLIDHMDIDLAIIPDETIDYNSQYLIASMKAAGKKSIFIPFAVPSADEVDDVLVGDSAYVVSDAAQRSFAWQFPKWIRTVDGVQLTRVPLGRAAAVEEDGLAPRHPWLSFTSESDAVGLNSPYLRERFVDLGAAYRRQSMFVIGSPEDDDIAAAKSKRDELRRELAGMFGWTDERPIALVNPVGDLSFQYRLPEFESYQALLRYWLQTLKGLTNFHVVITPHPSFRYTGREILETEAKDIAWRRASELIPACDLYVSYGGSSTLRLAAAAGLPILNYLCYALRLAPEDEKSYFVGFDSIVVARQRQEFAEAVERINDPQQFARLRELAATSASYFGAQAGDFSRRLMELAKGLGNVSGSPSAGDLDRLRNRLET